MIADKEISKEINQIGSILGKRSAIKLVILFGSHAYGQPNSDSDLDLCVIMDLAGKRKIEVMRAIRRELADSVESPLDILVYEEGEFNERAVLSSTMEHKILTEGIKIYEQQGHRTRVVQGS